jgi:hypothetical protein
MPNRQDPFDAGDPARYRPADARTQKELGGVLERAFERESGREPDEEEIRRLNALADEALHEAEIRLALAREAESALARAGEEAELRKWAEALETYRREAAEFRLEAERLRGYIA